MRVMLMLLEQRCHGDTLAFSLTTLSLFSLYSNPCQDLEHSPLDILKDERQRQQ